jgi:membrane protease YdiL (CAAX protease family)
VLIGVGAFFSLWVHRAKGNRALTSGLYLVFGAFGFFLFLFGLGATFRDWREGTTPDSSSWLAIIIGVIAALTMIPQLRRPLSRIIPFDPDSWPATVGLFLLGTLAAVSAFALFGPASENQSISYSALVITAADEVGLGFVAVGIWFYRPPEDAIRRLGLMMPTLRQIGIALAMVVVTLVVSALSSYLVQLLQPDLHKEITQNMEEMTSQINSVWGAMLLGICAGVGEEVLFRGAIQPKFGIVFTALVFALLHQQYGPSLITVGAFASGIVFGLERKYMNTTTCIITHSVYNFIAVLLTISTR